MATEEEVTWAIHVFPKGSAGGPDGLRPQHLKDMLSDGGSCHVLLRALVSFVQLVLVGTHNSIIRSTFLLWSESDSPPQETTWDLAYCSKLYPASSHRKGCWESGIEEMGWGTSGHSTAGFQCQGRRGGSCPCC